IWQACTSAMGRQVKAAAKPASQERNQCHQDPLDHCASFKGNSFPEQIEQTRGFKAWAAALCASSDDLFVR
ncbi:MAG TPA: hypothetical protein QF626_02390, partial [Prochlorococcaceae cyanobacterium Fu_MAG_50]|nr:hypothetical protein [Prochlorococcaceae cyanobacterium Fu_MAG_50]